MAQDLDRQRRDLERSNRLAAWAEMARQVAHEVKNPLTPIQLSAEHLRRVWHDRSEDFAATLQGCTQTILQQVRILRGLVTEFSAFARPPASRLESHDPAEIVAAVIEPYQCALPPDVRLSVEIEPGVPRARRPPAARAWRRQPRRERPSGRGRPGRIGMSLRLRRGAGGSSSRSATRAGVDPRCDRSEPFFSTKPAAAASGWRS